MLIKKGSISPLVKVWQEFLNAQGFNCGKPDENFGRLTYNATKLFQTGNGLDDDGKVGDLTFNKAKEKGFIMPEVTKDLIDRDYFFSNVLGNKRNVIEPLFDKFDKSELLDDRRKYAYFLATAELETAGTFKPVIEGYWIKNNRKQTLYNYYQRTNPYALKGIFPNGVNGVSYEGRGFVQITLLSNYITFQKYVLDKYGVDIVENPDKLLDFDIAFDCCELGMTNRDYSFTGKVLSDYINDKITDFFNSRKIINGLSGAGEIAKRAELFYKYLQYV